MSKCDIHLDVVSSKQGRIKGESADASHADQIEVLSFGWGGRAADMAGTASGKRSYQELQVCKSVDCATTALYSALANNETLSKVVLTVRKAGGEQLDYFTITLEKARITSIATRSGQGDRPELLSEQVNFAFRKVSMEYKRQRSDGQLGGGFSFQDDISPP